MRNLAIGVNKGGESFGGIVDGEGVEQAIVESTNGGHDVQWCRRKETSCWISKRRDSRG